MVTDLSLRGTSDNIRKVAQDIKAEIKGSVQALGGTLPRPLMERKTVILREPILKMLQHRLEQRK